MPRRITAFFCGLILAALPLASYAGKPAARAPTYETMPAVRDFIRSMHEQHGFDVDRLTAQFARVRPNQAVLKAIQPAAVPEQQRSWQRYRDRFVNSRRIDNGVAFWNENGVELMRAQALYGVPAEIIVAIIGVETEYGQNMGRFSVLEALASLAFSYPPRADFFRAELEQFLLLTRENDQGPLDVKGSYAGAIGIPQFMPSSLRRFAVDFDGDGRIDLRGSVADAIGSVGHFLQRHGWQEDAPVASPAAVSGEPANLVAAGVKPNLAAEDLARNGVTVNGGVEELPSRPSALIDLVTPGLPTEYWLGFDNFYVITRYNRSSFYAMSVFQLAEAIKNTRGIDSNGK
ncbi:lytic murein transglycosylase B [Propionivibrio soli]|uniref:lytic murein transglycosylase B n=1 Tax=Propionivibrio soli TaxID=2976531 RepID=UPI0021E8EA69